MRVLLLVWTVNVGSSSLKYLGITLESKWTMFGAHIRAASEKAQTVMAALLSPVGVC